MQQIQSFKIQKHRCQNTKYSFELKILNFQVFDSLPSPGSLSDWTADKLRMSRTSLAEVNTILILMITMLKLLDPSPCSTRGCSGAFGLLYIYALICFTL